MSSGLAKLQALGPMAVLKAFRPAAASLIERIELDLADLDARLAKVEAEDEHRRNFIAAEAMAPASANCHPAPARLR
jgi:hypothetical protein